MSHLLGGGQMFVYLNLPSKVTVSGALVFL